VKSELTPLALKLSSFGGAIAWLLGKGVSSNRLAGIFGTTPENIRVIAHRARTASQHSGVPDDTLGSSLSIEVARNLGIRIGPDDVVRTPARTRELEFVRNKVEEVQQDAASQYRFAEGVRALRKMMPLIGYPSDARRIALAARIHQQIAWFLVHSGRCASASDEARMARDLWRAAHRESESPEYVAGFVEAALIGSHALLLTRQPKDAMAILDIAKDAAESIGAPLGSDHYRQRGVALLQLREDQRAAQNFEKAAAMMEELGEASTPEQILLTGARHRSLLDVNCDQSESVLTAVQRGFGAPSLEASMALNWATATLLSTDSLSVNQRAIEGILSTPGPAAQFGHQVTIRKLLAITLELNLDTRLQRMWVRRALYENAFSRR
jgi:hypothetical protein